MDRLALFDAHLDVAPSAVAAVLRGRPTPQAERDDMTQDALMGLWKATGRWNGRGRFGGYAVAVCRWAVLDGMRQRFGRTFPEAVPWPDIDAADDTPGPERTACARLELAEVGAWLATLPDRTRAAVLSCPEGDKTDTVGRRFGVSGCRISQLRQQALRAR